MLIMGMLTGGIAYFRQVTLTGAAREATRYAATVPTGSGAVPTTWFDQIASRAIKAGDGQLEQDVEGQATCVAYVGYGSPEGSALDATMKREQTGTAAPTYTAGSLASPSSWCFDDGQGTTGRRVQVVVLRKSQMNVIFFGSNVTVSSRAFSRFEAVSP
jgi:hypothetical protein